MRIPLRTGLSFDELLAALPPQHGRKLLATLGLSLDRGARYDLVLFAHGRSDVVLSGQVQKALDRGGFSGAMLVAAGGCFTLEALALLRERGAVALSLSEFDWTDASYQAVRRPSRR